MNVAICVEGIPLDEFAALVVPAQEKLVMIVGLICHNLGHINIEDFMGDTHGEGPKESGLKRIKTFFVTHGNLRNLRNLSADPLLFWMAVASIVGMFIALFVGWCGGIYWAIIILLPAVAIGIFVSMIQIEKYINSVANLGSTRLLWLVFLTCAAYFSHGEAAGKVNEIFHVDSASLPHATAVATVLFILAPVAFMLLGLGLFKFALVMVSPVKGQSSSVVINVSVVVSSVSLAIVLLVASNDEVKTSLIYQFGVHYDFNLKSNCKNVKSGDGVLFIGPLQDRAIVVEHADKMPGLGLPIAKHVPPETYRWTTCSG